MTLSQAISFSWLSLHCAQTQCEDIMATEIKVGNGGDFYGTYLINLIYYVSWNANHEANKRVYKDKLMQFTLLMIHFQQQWTLFAYKYLTCGMVYHIIHHHKNLLIV